MIDKLKKILHENIYFDQPMAAHTTFKTGGNADMMLIPQGEAQLLEVLHTLNAGDCPFFVMGKGSNLLVSDSGFGGAVVKIEAGLSGVRIEDTRVSAQAGATLHAVALKAAQAGLRGLEFAAGIPGTLGGGAVMNAGAYGGELADVVTSVRLYEDGRVIQRTAPEMQFSYRTSIAQKSGAIILSAALSLKQGDKKTSLEKIAELNARRRAKQPLEYPSAGSTFKRPEGSYAGALIEQCGLKGREIGGAQVSCKHAGFIINTGGATSADIYSLIQLIKDAVYNETGVCLVPEVHFLGDFT